MITEFWRGTHRHPKAAIAFENLVKMSPNLTGQVIYRYPTGPTANGTFTVDAVIVSDQGQITVVDFTEDTHPGDHQKRQDNGFNLVESKVRLHNNLRNGRVSKVIPQTITFGPHITSTDETDPEHPVANTTNLIRLLETYQHTPPKDVDPAIVTKELTRMVSGPLA